MYSEQQQIQKPITIVDDSKVANQPHTSNSSLSNRHPGQADSMMLEPTKQDSYACQCTSACRTVMNKHNNNKILNIQLYKNQKY